MAALAALAPLDETRRALMQARIDRRQARARGRQRLGFLDAGRHHRRDRPHRAAGPRGAVRRQRDPGRPAAAVGAGDRPRRPAPGTPTEKSLRNVAYALLSGADGWMFDGEDALGQVSTMSLDNQRNLKLALDRDPRFMKVAAAGGRGDERLGPRLSGAGHHRRPPHPARVHHDDLPGPRPAPRRPPRALGRRHGVLRLDRRRRPLRGQQPPAAARSRRLDRALPAEDPDRRGGGPVEPAAQHAWRSTCRLPPGTIKVYVLVEQLEASFQLMEIRAALGRHFVGFNTGRWDYINSVSDALAWDTAFVNPNIDAIVMTYGYMRNYEDRVRRAVNTPDQNGRFALWQGGMEPNIPVGLAAGRGERHEAGGGGGRARAARGGQRQVGGPLEDGPHRAAGLGEGRPGEPARPYLPAARATAPPRPRRWCSWRRPPAPCAAPGIC